MYDLIVVGGGAAGFFGAIRFKELAPRARVAVLERSSKPLRKVSISGGGRCNVTHRCDDIERLLEAYPRGGPRLETLLRRFMPNDTVEWFRHRGVKLKTESDGRMFPVTDRSQTVVDCLLQAARSLDIEFLGNSTVTHLSGDKGRFLLALKENQLTSKRVLLTTGGGSKATEWLADYGHRLEEDIPSLFTFCCSDPLLADLAGLSVDKVSATLELGEHYFSEGPLLITHWGLSGPCVLKLSAFAARELFQVGYKATLLLDLLPDLSYEETLDLLSRQDSGKQVSNSKLFSALPKRLWQRLTVKSDIGLKQSWSKLKPVSQERLAKTLKSLRLVVDGKGQFKEEFVTSGGLPLHEVNIHTLESRRVPGLFVAGELLNVDGITGGFNFQNAWASGFVAGEGIAESLRG